LRGLSRHEARFVLRGRRILSLSDLGILENADTYLAFGKGPFPENAIGHYPKHLCVGGPLLVNGAERLVTMATEELGVVAGLGKSARINRASGGLQVQVAKRNLVRGQVLFHNVLRPEFKLHQIEEYGDRFIREAHRTWDPMVKHGGGLKSIVPKLVQAADGRMTVAIDIAADTGETMGANVITFMGDKLAEDMRTLIDQIGHTAICTNFRSGWHAIATGTWDLGEHGVVSRMMDNAAYAGQDVGRAVTHNKGVMNGVSAIAEATGQDVRAVEAACHAEASWHGGIRPLTTLTNRISSLVVARLELMLPVGTIGGATQEPIAMVSRKIMGVTGSRDLAGLIAATGLAQNVAALRMLAAEGVHGSHRRLRGA
jgi:hydroxymethylglutaryl-CoA reductase